MRNVDEGADVIGNAKFEALPEGVQEALGELAGAAREGLLALSVGVGLGVLAELMGEEVDDVVGPSRHDADRVAVRHGSEAGQVTLGGRRVPVERPRVRAADGSGEVTVATYAHFADRDPLTAVVLEQMLAGVSTRRFSRTREPVGEEVLDRERSTSKSAVSREFVGRTGERLRALMSRSLADVRLAALMLDGIELKGRCCVVQGMRRIVRYCAKVNPDPRWKAFYKLDVEDDLRRLQGWLEGVLTDEPPPAAITGLWFGLVNLDREGNQTLDMYIAGERHQSDPTAQVIGGSWQPRRAYANSHVLDRIAEATSLHDGGPLGDAEYRLGLTYGGLAVRWLAAAVDSDLLLGGSPQRVMRVGFDEGDWIPIGTLTREGLAFKT